MTVWPPVYVAILQRLGHQSKECCVAAKKRLHTGAAEAILTLADALRRTAFLDVSSLNFGGAKSTAVFFACRRPEGAPAEVCSATASIFRRTGQPESALSHIALL